MMRSLLGAGLILAAACGGDQASAPVDPPLSPALVTGTVTHDPDDPAIWVHPADPGRSLILGTNKVAAPDGALVVFGLDGRVRQTIAGLDRPNNVDIQTGVMLDGRIADLAVVTERLQHRLRIFEIPPDGGRLVDLGPVPVLTGEAGEAAEPMGIALYRRPADAAVFAVVAPKSGPAEGYLWQYRLSGNGRGGVAGSLVRRFGRFSGLGAAPDEAGEIEAIVVDDQLGFVYYADERYALRKWHADPDHPEAGRELAVFGLDGYRGDREGLAIYGRPDGSGFLVSTDQVEGAAHFVVYPREGIPGAPHRHDVLRVIRTTVDDTDGLEIAAGALPGFAGGLVVAMNSGPRNFALFSWDQFWGR